jgi:GDSL-like lipase/acylhydrolase family protein
MRTLTIRVMATLACMGSAQAEDSPACAVAHHLVFSEYGLARVAAAIEKDHRLDIAVVGTGSSILATPGGADVAYPIRLQIVLTRRLPDVTTRIVTYAKPRRTAAEMAAEFSNILKGTKPTLVIWQTGTVDAMRGVDPDQFHADLAEGIEKLQAQGIDVMLMNMQYSPRTESVIALGTYADNMRVAAQQREVPLFDRFAVMKHWSELGTFDLHAATKDMDTAAQVHDCVAQLLADLIFDGVHMSRPQIKVLQ